MHKLIYIFAEMVHLIKSHKLYILAPVLILLVFISMLVLYVGPTVVVMFIYAGV